MKTVIAGALGECVHVAGISNFLRLAENAGWRTIFLGPAVSINEIIENAKFVSMLTVYNCTLQVLDHITSLFAANTCWSPFCTFTNYVNPVVILKYAFNLEIHSVQA